jgi:uncharacterized protein (UPF0332 family)
VPPRGTRPATTRYARHEQALLRVCKADKKTLNLFAEGIYLEGLTARTLRELQDQVSADRLRLATGLLHAGDRLVRSRPPHYRSAVSRYYYCMYHAVRAVVYYVHGGDDYDAHSALPSQIPPDFVDSALWQNSLKDGRAHRNDADYDAYPVNRSVWRGVATDMGVQATQLLSLSEQYLRGKGCGYI